MSLPDAINDPDDDDKRPNEDSSGAQVSEGPNAAGNAETALGGADAVPDTPDKLSDAGGA